MPELRALPDLPVKAVLPALGRALAANRPVVLQAPPGSGKTTLVAPYLLDAPWLQNRRIVLLEPRRLAARTAARYMARLLGEPVGARVGYQVRLERRIGPETRIEIVTEGLLTQRLLHAPDLPEVGLVIFDEFHERSLHAGLGLAWCLEARAVLRPDLRLLAMSATLDAEPLARHLGEATILVAEARVWPVETRLLTRPASAPLPYQAAEAVRRALIESDGGILVFLPGEGEIGRTASLLRNAGLPAGVTLHPLFGALPRAAQDAAVEPPAPGCRKVVLATSIAESSLTIRGIRTVIDTGWMRVARFSPRNGMSRLETLRVTRDRADQRRGRAGREAPGLCYRLWDEATDRALAPCASPEILDADLAPTVLQAAQWGASTRTGLPWLTPPPDAAWRQASALLQELEACDETGRITPRGRRMAEVPVHPRLSHMILLAAEHGCAQRACLLAAALTEAASEPLLRHETDIRRLLDRLETGETAATEPTPPDAPGPQEWVHRVHRLAAQWSRRYTRPDRARLDDGRLLAWAFPDRIARRREADGRYLLVNGCGATLETSAALARTEWLVAAELQDDGPDARIRLAASLDPADLETDHAARFETHERVVWDRQTEAVVACARVSLGAIVVRETALVRPAPLALRQALCEGIRAKGLANLGWSPAARNLQGRVLFLRRERPDDDWPDVSDRALAEQLEAWLGPALDGLTRWLHVRRVDLQAPLQAWLGGRRQALETLAPTHLPVPSGSRIAVHYDRGPDPVLAVRLQEVFGLAETPRIAGGRVPVVLELLSPAMRPLQTTKDLASFWKTSYFYVRKEMRGRYPKHDWPEHPADARASRSVRKPTGEARVPPGR